MLEGCSILGLFIKSKIQFFESKSQHWAKGPELSICCLSSQRYNFLKANHNGRVPREFIDIVVYQVKDTIFWKQITTVLSGSSFDFRCLSSQRYNFLKANHNTAVCFIDGEFVVYQVKDTIFWKQITTFKKVALIGNALFIKSKIQFFESKSQLPDVFLFKIIVVYQVKDTIFWIENRRSQSKSQLRNGEIRTKPRCLSSQRYNFLKANHNEETLQFVNECVVYQVKDTIFWKQITTFTC